MVHVTMHPTRTSVFNSMTLQKGFSNPATSRVCIAAQIVVGGICAVLHTLLAYLSKP